MCVSGDRVVIVLVLNVQMALDRHFGALADQRNGWAWKSRSPPSDILHDGGCRLLSFVRRAPRSPSATTLGNRKVVGAIGASLSLVPIRLLSLPLRAFETKRGSHHPICLSPLGKLLQEGRPGPPPAAEAGGSVVPSAFPPDESSSARPTELCVLRDSLAVPAKPSRFCAPPTRHAGSWRPPRKLHLAVLE